MAKQITDWGEIVWETDEANLRSENGLKVGMVTMNVGSHQARHIHFEEQVLYVVQGEAVSRVGKQEMVMTPGSYYHWPAGIFHEMINTGDVPFRHLLICNVEFEDPQQRREEETEGEQETVSPDLIYVAVEAIRRQFLEKLHYSYVIFDMSGNLILQSLRFPAFCTECCSPQNNPGCSPCMIHLGREEQEREQSFLCPFGMEVFHYPIAFHGTPLGFIQGGYIRHTGGIDEALQKVYDVPESVVAGIRAMMRRIVKAIRNYCEFEQFRRELTERELQVSRSEESRRILLKNLKDAQYEMTDLRINNHFLFNTLNSMASMAVESNAMSLYQAIVDLSKMFRYSLQNQSAIVPLEKELEYLKAYLALQKLRYGDSLQVTYKVEPALLHREVPFNFLQPIAENAFVHGFQEVTDRKLTVEILESGRDMVIRIRNSGATMTEQICQQINRGLHAGVSHGLSMIYTKLQAIYGNDFTFCAVAEPDGGTCFLIAIPVIKTETEKVEKARPEKAG